MPAIRNRHSTLLTAPRQRLIHTNPRPATCAISTERDYPNVWSNSSSGIGSPSTPALCLNRSCRASALRFAVWSNASSEIAANTHSGAASCCPFSASGGDYAGEIAGALVGSPICSSIYRAVAGSVMNPTRRIRPSRSLAGVHPRQQRVLAPIADVQPLRCGEIIEVNRVNLHRLIYVTATRIQQSNYAVRTELSVRTPHMPSIIRLTSMG